MCLQMDHLNTKVLPTGFDDENPHEDSFYYAVQTSDTENSRVSEIKKVYIGYNIGNTKPTDVSFNEEDGDFNNR